MTANVECFDVLWLEEFRHSKTEFVVVNSEKLMAYIVLYDTLIEISKIFNPVYKECPQEDIYTSSDELLSLLYRTNIIDGRLNNKYPTV